MRVGKAPSMVDAGLVGLVAVFAIAGPGFADVINPPCDALGVTPLSIGALVDLVLSTLLEKGVSVVLVGAMTVVGLPWLVAGLAVSLLYLPRRLREHR